MRSFGGLGHYRMRGAFNVMTQEKFDAWLAEEEKSQLADATASPEATAQPAAASAEAVPAEGSKQ